jgi:ketosteroid isomerase-like protein
MSAELEKRIERLESRFQLDELVSAYCMACDDHDMVRLRSLFTDDVRIWSKDGVMNASGIDDVMQMFVNMFAIRGPSFHWTHDHTIRVSGPTDAEGLIMAHAETTPHDTVSLAAIRYRDKYRKEQSGWKIAERELSFLYYMPASDYSDHFKGNLRMRVYGEERPADYPESLPTWDLVA